MQIEPCYSTTTPGLERAAHESDALARLDRAVGRPGSPVLAELRVRSMDLTLCSAAALAVYMLRITPTCLGWEQRLVAYPPEALVESIQHLRGWADCTRRVCGLPDGRMAVVGRSSFDIDLRACRVPTGVVAAEARACEEFFDVYDAEEGVYRISLAAASIHLTKGKYAAKGGRQMLADVTKARHPSHVPLYPLQRALAEEVAMGRSLDALCSRSEAFSSNGKSPAHHLFRKMGVAGTRDCKKSVRYARVAPYKVAADLCAVVDIAPEEVGL